MTSMDTSVAGVTESVVDPTMLPDAAVIVVNPEAIAVANPLLILMVATPVLDELQITDAARSCVVLSVKVPVAVNCLVVPLAMLGLTGETAMDTSVAGVTVRVVVPAMFPAAAVIVDEPVANEVASPLLPAALLMAATAVVDELQTATVVRS